MDWTRIALRRLRDARAPAVGIAVVVLVTAFVAAAAPLLLGRAADDTLRSTIAAAPVDVRNLQLLVRGRIWPVGSDPMSTVAAAGDDLEGRLPTAVRDVVDARDIVVDTSRWVVTSRPVEERTIRLRIQPGAAGHVHLVEGRLPEGVAAGEGSTSVPAPATAPPSAAASSAAAVPVLEVALPVESARSLGTHVGEILELGLDGTNLSSFLDTANVSIEVVGIYEVTDPSDPYWFNDRLLAGPSIRSISQLAQVQDLTALIAPAAYPALLSATAHGPPLMYWWRLTLDPARIIAGGSDAMLAALRRVESLFPSSTPRAVQGADPTAGAAIRSGLLGLIEREQAQWTSAVTVLTITVIGASVVAAAALALVAILAAGRRRRSLATWQARGASRGQLLAALVAEGAVVAGPAAAVGAAAALILVPGSSMAMAVLLAAGVGLLTVIFLVATSSVRGDAPPDRFRRPGARRLVLESVVVGLAIVGGLLLRERGVRGAGAAGQLTGADPFVAAVPALFGIAAGIIALRLLPLPIGLVTWLAARRRGLVPVLALRRVSRGSGSGPILLVLLAATAIGTFSSVTLIYLDRAAEAISWANVGAPFRLTTADPGGMPSLLDPPTLPGITARAGAFEAAVLIANRGTRLTMLAVDAAAYAGLTAGTPADPSFPRELLDASPGGGGVGVSGGTGASGGTAAGGTGASGGTAAGGTGATGTAAAGGGTPATPVLPAIVSTDLASGSNGLGIGTVFEVTLPGSRAAHGVSFRPVEVRSAFPGLPTGATFVVASRDELLAALPDLQLPTTTLYLQAPESAAPTLRATIAARVPGAVVTMDDRAAEGAALRSSPYVGTVTGGVAVAALLAVGYAILAVMAGLALSGASRTLELAHLRALGLPRRRTLGIVLVEHGPTVAFAVAAGAALGAGLFVLLQPGLGLVAIVGSPVDVPLGVDLPVLGLAFVGVVTIVAAGIALATTIERRVAPALALRKGFE